MNFHTLDAWQHSHHFHVHSEESESNTWRVIWLTIVMMIIEISAGLLYGSIALLADGWHMGTHAAALGITVFAYRYARLHEHDQRYTFGTGKVSALGGFASAIVLVIIAALMLIESLHRVFSPIIIHFNEAILVAFVGLVVNLISAMLLQHHDHHHDENEHLHHHTDQNLRAAYLHVMTDALTSVLAIIALLAGKAFGWVWMDPVVGIVGAVIITRWSYGLLRDTSQILLDNGGDIELLNKIRHTIEIQSEGEVADLHLWQMNSQQFALILSVVTHIPQSPEYYKNLLASFTELQHITVEVNFCACQDGVPKK